MTKVSQVKKLLTLVLEEKYFPESVSFKVLPVKPENFFGLTAANGSFEGLVICPVGVSLAWTVAFFFGVLAALDVASVKQQCKGLIQQSEIILYIPQPIQDILVIQV